VLHIPYKFLAKKIFEKADKIICVSNYEKRLILKNFRVKEEKVAIIPNGVNFEEFEKLEKRVKNHRIILCVSRLEEYKGIDFLIKVMPKLETDIHLEIVGKGPYEKNLKKLANRLRVTERVTFYKDLPREKLLIKYANADLFALLSRHEAYGISVAEALCAGTPCIVANTSALTEWVDGENCFGIDYPIDVDVLGDLIKKVIGQRVCKPLVLDWDEVANRLAALYEDVCFSQ
jgi:glycosyltransferase involved in cell wall biosynthesis